jgi:hypothetical protein
MKQAWMWGLFPLAIAATAGPAWAQVDYQRAEQFLTWNTTKLILRDVVTPNWRPDGNRFWYRVTTANGADFVLVDPARDTRRIVFDNARLAAALSLAADTAYDPFKLPFTTFDFADGEAAIEITANAKLFRCVLAVYQCTVGDTLPSTIPYVVSPDSAWEAFVHEYNIYVRPHGGGDSIQLTTDGVEFWSYGLGNPRPLEVMRKTPRRPTCTTSPPPHSGRHTTRSPMPSPVIPSFRYRGSTSSTWTLT